MKELRILQHNVNHGKETTLASLLREPEGSAICTRDTGYLHTPSIGLGLGVVLGLEHPTNRMLYILRNNVYPRRRAIAKIAKSADGSTTPSTSQLDDVRFTI
jgi:hypothetical protein